MTRTEFIDAIAQYGARLRPSIGHDFDERRKYVETLVALSQKLAAPSAPTSNLESFRSLIMADGNADSILRLVAGALALRRRDLPSRTRGMIAALGTPSDLLGLSGHGRSEVAHTRAIGSFLNCERSPFPELAQECARAFESMLSEAEVRAGRKPLPVLQLERAQADCEVALPSGDRVDLALRSPDAVLYIEAKVDAAERAEQLEDYGHALAADARHPPRRPVLVFLTVTAEQTSSTKHPYVHVTFRDLLLAWLPIAATGTRGADDLARYLKSLATHLYAVAANGSFDEWPLQTQRACMTMLEKGSLS